MRLIKIQKIIDFGFDAFFAFISKPLLTSFMTFLMNEGWDHG
jgi:hypothetical protein